MANFLACRDLAGRLVPVDDLGREAIKKVPTKATVMVEIRRPRNVQWHKKMFALFNLLFQNQTRFPTMDDMRSALLVYVGFCTEIQLKDGRTVYVPKSLSFAKLDQQGFEQLWDALVRMACEKILPGVTEADLRREIEEMVT